MKIHGVNLCDRNLPLTIEIAISIGEDVGFCKLNANLQILAMYTDITAPQTPT